MTRPGSLTPQPGQNYDHLFATNAPPAPKGKTGGGSGSFYVQSKIVRARERIEAEWKEAAKAFEQQKEPPAPAKDETTR